MVIATLLWGGTFVAIRDSVARIDPIALVAIRFLVAGAIALLLALVTRRRFDGDALRGGALAGVLFAAGFAFQAIGLVRTTAGTSAFLTSTGSLMAAWFAWPLLGQRPGLVLSLGVALAVAGTALLGADAGLRLGAGERWTLLGAAAFALQIIAVARFAPRADPLALVAVQACTMAAILLPISWARWPRFGALDATDAARLIYLIVAGSLVAPWLQIVAQTSLPAGRIGLLFTLEPVFALIVALTLGAERFPWRWWWGAAMVLLAVTMVEISAARSTASRRASA
jgi:drug/metabolite transporter (DMT)-like permease